MASLLFLFTEGTRKGGTSAHTGATNMPGACWLARGRVHRELTAAGTAVGSTLSVTQPIKVQTSPFRYIPPLRWKENRLPRRCAPRNDVLFCSAVQKFYIFYKDHRSNPSVSFIDSFVEPAPPLSATRTFSPLMGKSALYTREPLHGAKVLDFSSVFPYVFIRKSLTFS